MLTSHFIGLSAALFHVTTSGAVSLHVLLTKRDVRAAIGWIGLAWLSPIVGAAIYYLFGINRVKRRTSRLTPGTTPRKHLVTVTPATPAIPHLAENIATIAKVSERASKHLLARGNALSILHAGDQAYPAMLDAIGGAQRSIVLASYIFRDDRIGRAFAEALTQALSRGVQIRVLIDGMGGGYLHCPIRKRLAAAGIPVALFMHDWLPWRMPFLNMRNHKKLLIVDGTLGFTGGMNIAAQNVLAENPPNPVRDIHFRLDGPIVRQLMVTFAEDWNFTTGEVLDDEVWWPEIPAAGPVPARGVSSGPDEEIGVLTSILATAMGETKRSLRIVTPYFLPDQALTACITLAAMRGVVVDIVLPERSDHVTMGWAMHAHLALLTAPGIRLHLSPPPFDHSKLMTVDGAWCLVGSANWDVRSSRLNFEFNVECYGSEATSAIDRVIDDKIAAGRRIPDTGFAKRSLPIQIRDAAARLMLPYL